MVTIGNDDEGVNSNRARHTRRQDNPSDGASGNGATGSPTSCGLWSGEDAQAGTGPDRDQRRAMTDDPGRVVATTFPDLEPMRNMDHRFDARQALPHLSGQGLPQGRLPEATADRTRLNASPLRPVAAPAQQLQVGRPVDVRTGIEHRQGQGMQVIQGDRPFG